VENWRINLGKNIAQGVRRKQALEISVRAAVGAVIDVADPLDICLNPWLAAGAQKRLENSRVLGEYR
jgi:hypothetical protein